MYQFLTLQWIINRQMTKDSLVQYISVDWMEMSHICRHFFVNFKLNLVCFFPIERTIKVSCRWPPNILHIKKPNVSLLFLKEQKICISESEFLPKGISMVIDHLGKSFSCFR